MGQRRAAWLRVLTVTVAGALVSLQLSVVAPLRPAAGAPSLEAVSLRNSDGAVAGGEVVVGKSGLAVSADGRFVGFISTSDLAGDGADPASSMFVRDRQLGRTVAISRTTAGANVPHTSVYALDITPDGRHVCFESDGSYTSINAHGNSGIYVRDRDTDRDGIFDEPGAVQTVLMSRPLVGEPNGGADGCSMSADGRYVTFGSPDANLVAGDANFATRDIFVADRDPDGNGAFDEGPPRIEIASVNGTTQGNAGSGGASITPDGRSVLFQTDASNFDPTDTNGTSDIYLRDRRAGTLTRMSRALGGGAPNGTGAFFAAMSQDARVVTFKSDATDLGVPNPPGVGSMFAVDRATGETERISPEGVGEFNSNPASLSADGRYVAFITPFPADPADTDGFNNDVYIRDRRDGSLIFATSSAPGTSYQAGYDGFDLSAGGRHLAFYATAGGQLLPGDTNGLTDVYLLDRDTAPRRLEVGLGPGGASTAVNSSAAQAVDIGALTTAADQSASRLDASPLRGIDAASTPLREIDLASSPLRGIPLRGIPLRGITLAANPLRGITLDQVPLRRTGGWRAVLDAAGSPYVGVPVQGVSLAEIIDLLDLGAASPLPPLTLTEVDLAGSPLRGITLASLALGAVPLRGIPLTPDWSSLSDAAKIQRFCDAIAAGGGTCLQPFNLDSTLLALDLAGVPLRGIPLRGIPLRGIDLSASPLRGIPLRGIHWESTPLRGIPLRGIAADSAPLRGIPLRGIPLRGIDLSSSPLRGIPLRGISPGPAGTVVDCARVDCSSSSSATLQNAAEALPDSAIRSGATLGMILDNLDGFTLGDVYGGHPGNETFTYGGLTIEDLLPAIPDGYTLGDLLLGLLDPNSVAFESAPATTLSRLADLSSAGIPLHGSFVTDGGSGRLTNVRISVRAPDGFGFGNSAIGAGVARAPLTGVEVATPTIEGSRATWNLGDLPAGAAVFLDTRLRPGATLCTCQVVLELTSDQGGTITTSATIATAENYEPTNNDANALDLPVLLPDTIYFSHVATAGDVDYWRIPTVPAGAHVSVSIVSPSDTDLVMYRPNDATAVARASRAAGLSSVPVDDANTQAGAQTNTPQAAVLRDVPVLDRPIASVSADSGGNETVATTSLDQTDGYIIQVSGYNGATSPVPYVLRLRILGPAGLQTCGPRSYPGAPATSMPTSIPLGTDTLVLVNEQRLAARFGDVSPVLTKVHELTTAPGVQGLVLPVDSSPVVRDKYSTWDQNPCNVAAANDVVSEINRLVDGLIAASPPGAREGLRSIVLVGGDDALPFFRSPDATVTANEFGYAGDLLAEETDANTPLAAAGFARTVLTDDAYGDFDPVTWLDHQLYVPDVAVGRLVETPSDIVSAIDQYELHGGMLDPTTGSLAAGYDFLNDGTRAVDAQIGPHVSNPANRQLLTDDTGTPPWNRQTLHDALIAPKRPAVASVNAHFDHHEALPASGNTTGDRTDLFTTADVPPGSRPGAIVFSMGCHSGLAVPDSDVGTGPGQRAHDWAQTYAEAGAAVYVGNTGYGYGESRTVALSERLMALFAERLDGNYTVGRALMHAKQQYFAGLGVYGAHDEKALIESTFYGLPMYRLGTGTEPPEPRVATSVDRGLASYLVTSAPNYDAPTRLADGSQFLAVHGQAPQVTEYEPIQPRFSLPVTAATPVRAHGALLERVTVARDSGWRAAFSRPVTDQSSKQPALAGDGVFPAQFLAVNNVTGSSGAARDQLVVIPGQWSGNPATPGVGTQLRFTDLAARVYYSNSADSTAPSLGAIDATISGGVARFSVPVSDQSGVVRVLLLVDDGAPGWHPVELTDPDANGVWTGSLPTTSGRVGYLVQALDGGGNVGTSSARGALYHASSIPVTVDAGPDTTTTAGSTISSSAAFHSTGSASYTATVDWGEGAGPESVPTTGTTVPLVHRYAAPGTFGLGVVVCDDTGTCGTDNRVVTVLARPVPEIAVGDASALEGTSGNRTADFAVTLSEPRTTPTVITYRIGVSTGDTASPSRDFHPATGALTIAAGRVVGFVRATIRPDVVIEPDETFTVQLTRTNRGSIVDASGQGRIIDAGNRAGLPRLHVGSASVSEGNAGSREVHVSVNLSRPLARAVILSWSTVDGSALAGADYRAASGTMRLRAGSTSSVLTLVVYPNRIRQSDRNFGLRLTALPVTVSAVTGTGIVAINDDD